MEIPLLTVCVFKDNNRFCVKCLELDLVTEMDTIEEAIEEIIREIKEYMGIEIIGETVKNLSSELKEEHKDIDWRKIVGMRDKIIHYYFGVNWNIVWTVIHDKIPELKQKIEIIIRKMEGSKA